MAEYDQIVSDDAVGQIWPRENPRLLSYSII